MFSQRLMPTAVHLPIFIFLLCSLQNTVKNCFTSYLKIFFIFLIWTFLYYSLTSAIYIVVCHLYDLRLMLILTSVFIIRVDCIVMPLIAWQSHSIQFLARNRQSRALFTGSASFRRPKNLVQSDGFSVATCCCGLEIVVFCLSIMTLL